MPPGAGARSAVTHNANKEELPMLIRPPATVAVSPDAAKWRVA